MNFFLHKTYVLGEWIIFFLKLQFFWIIFTLKGAIIFGMFPSFAIVIYCLQLKFQNKLETHSLYNIFKHQFHQNFKALNLLGFSILFSAIFFWFDMKLASHFLQNQWIHFFLLGIFIICLSLSFYIYPCYFRYQLTFLQIFQQSLFLLLSNIVETVAIIIGIALVNILMTAVPILSIFCLIPILMLPISWFTYQAMTKLEVNCLEKGGSS